MKIALISLGCKVNQAEILQMEQSLISRGHEIIGIGQSPDICVVNTCTVTSKSDYQSRQMIRRAGKSGARVMVTGCFAHLNRDEVFGFRGVEEIISNDDKAKLISLIEDNPLSVSLSKERSRTRMILKVQDGCNYACSYCLISKARGKSRSVSVESIINSVNKAVDDEYKEVVLAGVHLGQYGLDLVPKMGLCRLIENILNNTSIYRIRLSSLQPQEIDDDLLGLLKDRRICKHLHIPLQAGHDRILSLMGRSYDTSEYEYKVQRISSELGKISIGTDIIAGFPQEKETEFRDTCSFVENLPLTYMHVFPYSPRPGTEAAHMVDIVGDRERKYRTKRLIELSSKFRRSYMISQVGETLEVLVEEVDDDLTARGTSSNYLRVQTLGHAFERGSIVNVRALGINGNQMVGDLQNQS